MLPIVILQEPEIKIDLDKSFNEIMQDNLAWLEWNEGLSEMDRDRMSQEEKEDMEDYRKIWMMEHILEKMTGKKFGDMTPDERRKYGRLFKNKYPDYDGIIPISSSEARQEPL